MKAALPYGRSSESKRPELGLWYGFKRAARMSEVCGNLASGATGARAPALRATTSTSLVPALVPLFYWFLQSFSRHEI